MTDDDDDDILAGEYALGVLEGAEAEAADARLATDVAFAERVAWWRDRLCGLADDVAADPSSDLWPGIAARLSANDNAPLLSAMRRWRAAAIGFGTIAAALVAVMLLRPLPSSDLPSAPMIASLSGERGAVVTVTFDRGTRHMLIAPVAVEPGLGSAELWVIPDGGKPVSMGVLDGKRPENHLVPAELAALVRAGATFAVSIEPKLGSPNGQPTGPVVASGKMTVI